MKVQGKSTGRRNSKSNSVEVGVLEEQREGQCDKSRGERPRVAREEMERQVAQYRRFKMFAVYSKSDGNLLESMSRE